MNPDPHHFDSLDPHPHQIKIRIRILIRNNVMRIHNTGVVTQVRSEEEGSQEEDAENLRNRLISRQAELAVAQEKIQEILTEKEMLR